MKIIGTSWFANSTGAIGIVVAENDAGETLVYVGNGDGHDEQTDIRRIMDWGTKCRVDDFAGRMRRLGAV